MDSLNEAFVVECTNWILYGEQREWKKCYRMESNLWSEQIERNITEWTGRTRVML